MKIFDWNFKPFEQYVTKESYLSAQKHSRLTCGQEVLVTRIILRSHENMWPGIWTYNMTMSIGRKYNVVSTDDWRGVLLSNGFFYPFYVLKVTRSMWDYIQSVRRYVKEVEPDSIYSAMYYDNDEASWW